MWQAVSVWPATFPKYAEQPEPANRHAFSAHPRGTVVERARVVPPTATTLGELGGKLAGPYPKSPVEAPAVTPGWSYRAACLLVPVSSIRPKEWLVTVAPAATAVASARPSAVSVGWLASTRTMWQVGQAAEIIWRSRDASTPQPKSCCG